MQGNSTATAPTTQLFDAGEVRRTLQLFMPAGQVTELRALEATTNGDRWPHTASGYFDDPDKLVAALASVRAAKSLYVVPNPVNPALLARAANRIRKADKGGTTGDGDIIARRWLLVDCDPQRPAGISATDVEHEAALERCRTIWSTLHYNYGWPEPIAGDSGNGGHLLYRVDLPADDGGLIQRCLAALAAQFDDAAVKVDTGVFNPARIWKLYGTLACKGDSTPDRPHRMSRILSAPSPLVVVSNLQLAELASEAPQPVPRETNGHSHNGNGFDVDSFIQRHGFEVDGPDAYQGGRKWTFRKSPLCEHHGDGPYLIQFASGALSAGCHHNSCGWTWHDLRAKYQPKRDYASDWPRDRPAKESNGTGGNDDTSKAAPCNKFTFAELQAGYPHLNPPVVHGLFREGETVNVISTSKVGKSWLAYNLGLSIIAGHPWLERFETECGKVLLIDNELHRGTLANRIPAVAREMGIQAAEYAEALEVWPLRGNLRSLIQLGDDFAKVEAGQFKAIILDAKYRFAIPGKSENDNAAETLVYNLLDEYAAHTKAAFVLVHHTSKGSQGEKRITDVGAGAGAQSRAADCHLVLREHEHEDVAVLDAAVRSFAPVEPLALRWEFPLWRPDIAIDPDKLKGRLSAGDQRQQAKDREATDAILKLLRKSAATATQLRDQTGFSRDRLLRLVGLLRSAGSVGSRKTSIKGNECDEYHLLP